MPYITLIYPSYSLIKLLYDPQGPFKGLPFSPLIIPFRELPPKGASGWNSRLLGLFPKLGFTWTPKNLPFSGLLMTLSLYKSLEIRKVMKNLPF